MTATFTFETKSQLAKLLATENITMQHNPSVRTAFFDIKQRLLVLPVWQNISEDLYDLMVLHEVGHALDTDLEAWMTGMETIANQHHTNPSNRVKSVVKDFMNVVEDARIDKRQKRRYPGSRKNYAKGYAELHERDFFKIRGKDVNALTFIDRANIYFKGGYALGIKFSAEEKAFITRMENAETFDDVVGIASDVYGYARTTEKENREQQQEAQGQSEEMNTEFELSDEDMDELEDMASNDDMEEMSSDDDTASSDDDTDEDTDEGTEETVAEQKMEKGEEGNEEFVPEVETEEAARDNASTIVASDDTEYFYIDIPTMHHDKIVDDYTVVIPQLVAEIGRNTGYFNDHSRAVAANQLNEWKSKEKDAISFMVKEFEMKKAADAYARTSISKTGVLNTNKVHAYKFNEDIFRKVTTVRDGKNHGFVMFLDWSGSMHYNLRDTMKQLFSLVLFCKRVQIPFEVYTFRDHCPIDGDLTVQYTNTSQVGLHLSAFKLRNVLSSRMPLGMLNTAMQMLWAASYRMVQCDEMNGTPLNSALLAADKVVNDFRKRNKVQVVSTIILTDGASNPVRATQNPFKRKVNYIFRDPITKKTYFLPKGRSLTDYATTDTFLRILKDRTQSNLVGFYLCAYSLKSLAGCGVVDDTVVYSQEARDSWKDNNFFATTTAGYDEYYIINVNGMTGSIQKSMNVGNNMTKARITKEFMKYSNKKAVNRILLSKFINRIAKDEPSKKVA